MVLCRPAEPARLAGKVGSSTCLLNQTNCARAYFGKYRERQSQGSISISCRDRFQHGNDLDA